MGTRLTAQKLGESGGSCSRGVSISHYMVTRKCDQEKYEQHLGIIDISVDVSPSVIPVGPDCRAIKSVRSENKTTTPKDMTARHAHATMAKSD